MRRMLSLLFSIVLLPAWADPIVSDVVVNQRWPWSEKVDVDFTLTGETSDVDVYATWDALRGDAAPGVASSVLLGTVFAATPGQNHFTWDPAASTWSNKTLTGFSVSPAAATATAHKYLVVDLAKGGYGFLPDVPPGGWGDEYKTTKMVFRRIPAGMYQLGMESNLIAKVNGGPVDAAYVKAWKRHDITFTSDFYVGIFKLTVAQCNQLKGAEVGSDKRPQALSYDELRGVTNDGINWPTSRYAVATGSLVAAMRAKAGAGLVVDLCQECQWEAAMRAGATTIWPNGGTAEDSLSALTNIVGEIAWGDSSHEVGLKTDNGWGIYDPVGLCPEWTLDKATKNAGGNLPKMGLSSVTDPTGSSTAFATYRIIRGGGGSKLFDLLPCRRFLYPHENVVAGARFCIHLKPLNFKD